MGILTTWGVREFHKVAPIVKEKISTAEKHFKNGYVMHVNFCHIPCGSIDIEAQ